VAAFCDALNLLHSLRARVAAAAGALFECSVAAVAEGGAPVGAVAAGEAAAERAGAALLAPLAARVRASSDALQQLRGAVATGSLPPLAALLGMAQAAGELVRRR
jgi:hypothetical protein